MNATADELSLLLLCNGSVSVAQIAERVRRDPAGVAQTLARFCHAGIIEIATASAPPSGPAVGEAELARPVRYWRGHMVE